MASILQGFKWLYKEFSLKSLQDTGRDAWIIIGLRFCRMIALGTNSLILALFFAELQFSDYRIGLFMTLAMVGTVLLSLSATMVADWLGWRRILLGGAFMMVLSGATFAYFENFWILLIASVLGVISVSGSDYGPFRPIEESMLSELTTPTTRTDVLAWYVTIASVGSAIGSEISGHYVNFLQNREGWNVVDAYHAVFWINSCAGLLNVGLTLLLSSKCEAREISNRDQSEVLLDNMDQDENATAPDTTPAATVAASEKPKSRFAQISRETRSIMYKLWFLLIIDAMSDGMTGYSLTTYYMDLKFHPSKSTLGNITSVSYLLSSVSSVFSGPLSRRLGLINTMVFTHVPSSAAVLLFPAPRDIYLTVALFFVRTGLNNMDQAPRSTFIAAVVKAEERTAVMGITAMLRNLAATIGPSITGVLAGNDKFWIAFVVAGTLRLAYDFGLFAMFVNMPLYQHEPKPSHPEELSDDGEESTT